MCRTTGHAFEGTRASTARENHADTHAGNATHNARATTIIVASARPRTKVRTTSTRCDAIAGRPTLTSDRGPSRTSAAAQLAAAWKNVGVVGTGGSGAEDVGQKPAEGERGGARPTTDA